MFKGPLEWLGEVSMGSLRKGGHPRRCARRVGWRSLGRRTKTGAGFPTPNLSQGRDGSRLLRSGPPPTPPWEGGEKKRGDQRPADDGADPPPQPSPSRGEGGEGRAQGLCRG